MKYLFIFVWFVIAAVHSYAVPVKIHVLCETGNAVGADICVNDKVVAVADTNGIASCQLNTDDILCVKYIGYENFIVEKKDISGDSLRIELTPEIYKIDNVVIASNNDNELFKSLLSKRIKVKKTFSHNYIQATDSIITYGATPYWIQSFGYGVFLIVDDNTFRSFFQPQKCTVRMRKNSDTAFAPYQEADSLQFQKKWIDRLFSRFARPALLTHNVLQNKNIKLYYRGQQDSVYVFSFYMKPRTVDESAYINGLMRIDISTNIPVSAEFNFFSNNPQSHLYKYIVRYSLVGRDRIYPTYSQCRILFRNNETLAVEHEINGIGCLNTPDNTEKKRSRSK